MSTSHRTRMEHTRNIMEQYHITYVSRRTNEENDEGEEESDSLGSSDSSDNDDVDGVSLGDHDGEEDFVFDGSEDTPSEESVHTETWRCRRPSNGEEDDGEEYDDEEYDDEEDDDA